jgi:heterodisulfide reductase subunit A-like polyferredoxin
MGLELNEFGYFAGTGFGGGLEASRPGVFLAGACCGPADIQASRKQALAVAGLLAQRLEEHERRPASSRAGTGGGVHVKEKVG